MNKNKSRFWEEIRSDYIDDTELETGFAEMYIDAWEHGKEEGRSIARVIAVNNFEKNMIKVVYIDNLARGDKYAQEVIQDGIKIMEEYEF